MKKFNFALSLIALLSSCQTYRQNFDCPPGKGVPCTPITDIERMIIETPEGSPDLFLGYLPSECQSGACCPKNSSLYHPPLENCQQRIWIEGRTFDCGTYIDGHYIYINMDGQR